MNGELLDNLCGRFGDAIKEINVKGPRRVFITVSPDAYKEVIHFLHEQGFDFLEAITGIDAGDCFVVMAHIGKSVSITVRTRIPRDDPKIPSIVDVYPGAEVYEREAHEMLGIVFEGNPRLERLLLPEDWPKGVYPLRKDYDPVHPESLR